MTGNEVSESIGPVNKHSAFWSPRRNVMCWFRTLKCIGIRFLTASFSHNWIGFPLNVLKKSGVRLQSVAFVNRFVFRLGWRYWSKLNFSHISVPPQGMASNHDYCGKWSRIDPSPLMIISRTSQSARKSYRYVLATAFVALWLNYTRWDFPCVESPAC